MKKYALFLCLTALLFFTAGCGSSQADSSQPEETQTENSQTEAPVSQGFGPGAASALPEVEASVTEDVKYQAATVSLSQSEFEAAGFALGDSCDIAFSNGYSLTDVPYYNGFYIQTGDPVIVAYSGSAHIIITLNSVGIWETADLREEAGVTITLHEAGKYSDIQESLNQTYSSDRADYTSDEQYCNFRALTGGSLKKDFFYRGASPVDSSWGRAPYTDALLEQAGIRFVLDLADSQEDVDGFMADDSFDSPYTASLLEEGKAAMLDMGSSFESEPFRRELITGLRQMMEAEGPVYIHCLEGKDRTGFVCMLLEALAGASYDEMMHDYMITYSNYYGITEEETPEKYDAIAGLYFEAFAEYLHGTDDMAELTRADYAPDAAAWLIEGGMTQEEVDGLVAYLTE